MKRLTAPLMATIIILAAMAMLPSCNKDSNEDEDPSYQRGTELTVTRFYLKADNKVMPHLDSVYFSIDVARGVIFNADSLPMGTPVNKLVPMITVPSSIQRVSIVMEDEQDGTVKVVNYRESPGDTIDFTKKVTLELSILNEEMTRTYRLMVNVHKMNPDSLYFDVNARMAVPSRMPNPNRQKTISRDGTVYMMIAENDGTHTLATTKKMEEGQWTKQKITIPEKGDVESFTATSDAFYLLTSGKLLYRSADGMNWENTGVEGWTSIIGGFNDRLLGVKEGVDHKIHTQYPLGDYSETPLENDFPYTGASPMSIYTTKWSSLPLGLISGGHSRDGLVGVTWAFDGTNWCNISTKPMPPLRNGTMIPYFAYLKSTSMWLFNEYSVWLYVGGIKENGDINKTVYISYDNGVNWHEAPQAMQLPESIAANGNNINHAIIDTPLEADFLPEVWNKIGNGRYAFGSRLLPYVINGYSIEWNCPYIYLVGGIPLDNDNRINPWIYRGVINRMTFKPLI